MLHYIFRLQLSAPKGCRVRSSPVDVRHGLLVAHDDAAAGSIGRTLLARKLSNTKRVQATEIDLIFCSVHQIHGLAGCIGHEALET